MDRLPSRGAGSRGGGRRVRLAPTLRELVKGKTDYVPDTDESDRNTDNRFLYRETERFIISALKLRSPNLPKTAVGDAIGSAATKAQYVLTALRGTSYVPPLDPWILDRAGRAAATVIEAYPGVTKVSNDFENLELPHGTKMRVLGKSDPEDALRCAMVAACYASMVGFLPPALPGLYVPTDATAQEKYDTAAISAEGWIFTPK